MNATTSHGTWANYGDGEVTLHANVTTALGEHAADYDIDALTDAYQDAINNALPEDITLAGDEFYGPAPRPETASQTITDAIGSVDFWELAEQHDTTSTTTSENFTAWLAIDPRATLGDHCGVTVNENKPAGVELYRADTTVPASTELDVRDAAKEEAEDILADAGWRTVGEWQDVDYGYSITVRRNKDESTESAEDEGGDMEPAIVSVVRGDSPDSRAVEFGPHGVNIPAEVLDWAEGHGLSIDDPDVYLLVTPADEAGQVAGEIAYATFQLPAADVATIRAAL